MTPDLPEGFPSAHSAIGLLVRRAPVVAPMDGDIGSAVRKMVKQEVSSIIVVDPASGAPLGIFTLRDLVRRVDLDARGLAEPIAAVMTAGLVTLPASAPVHQAATLMARRRLHHVVVVDERGSALGVVTQTDLIGLSRLGTHELAADIGEADSIEALGRSQADVRRLTQRLVAQRVGADSITQLVVALNDLITSRVIELTLDEIELPDIAWCWIALGSEGRLEQTLATDQDNGIIFLADPDEAARLRGAFLPFARLVNERLAECGFPLCKGAIMAGNPRWCLALPEWEERFARWIGEPQPEALLNASIFFDLRSLFGDASLAERLRAMLLAKAKASPLFLRMMAVNALGARPPLGLVRDFRYDDPAQPGTIELKMYGARPLVDAARLFALANGIGHTNTAARLLATAEAARFGGDDVHAVIDAFWFIQSMRLRAQVAIDRGGSGAPNRIAPALLNEMDRRILKEAFRQARNLQNRLSAEYRL